MKKQFLAICVLSAVMLSSCSNVDNMSADEVQTTASENVIYYEGKAFLRDELSSETIEWLEQYNSLSEESKQVINYIPYELLPKESFSVFEIETEISTETITEETESTELETETETEAAVGETDMEIINRIKSIDVSAYDKYSFVRKYDVKAENLYIISEIVGDKAESDWVDNVYLKKSDEERNALPAVYQAIVELGISEEDFRKKNEEYIDYPDMLISEEMLSALYSEDINEMKRLLADPWALYYDGEVYAFDEMYADPNIVADVPADVMNEYLDFIEAIDEVKVRN